MHNRDSTSAGDTLMPLPGPAAPYAHPLGFPATVDEFGDLTRESANLLLTFYALAVIPAPVPAHGHGAAAAAAAAASTAERLSGLKRLGKHIGLQMGDSLICELERGIARAFNGSAQSLGHALKPLRGSAPPFHLPAEVDLMFPATDGAFRNLTLDQAKALCVFYGIQPGGPQHVFELDALRGIVAEFIGFRQ